MKRTGHQVFAALRIEGSLLPPEFLGRIARLAATHQDGPDYNVPKGISLKDDIGRAWRIAVALRNEFQQRRQRADLDPGRVAVDDWQLPFLTDVLGFRDLGPVLSLVRDERRWPISHQAFGGAVPLVLTDAQTDLDRADPRFGDDGRRRAPHALIQEFLNAETEAVWGIIGNGDRLRLVRDNPSLTRPAYIEADLERMFEEQLFADFAAFWLTFHATRLAPREGKAGACRLEAWRAEGHKTGERALGKLRVGVTEALRALGSGFVGHPDNHDLRRRIEEGGFSADDLFQELLRLVYRMLFLLTAEDRDLLFAPEADPQAKARYSAGYSLSRLRDRARLRRHHDTHPDLWRGLRITFRSLAAGARPLGLPALGGLFDRKQCPTLDRAEIDNASLLKAVFALSWFQTDGALARVNYRDMDVEELGSVYESLLELHPTIEVEGQPWRFGFVGDDGGGAVKGSERKLSGSYYTPPALVQELIRSALVPVIAGRLAGNPARPREALLDLRVIDPACGSGHFLLAAARRLAVELARLNAVADVPDENTRRHALREVVQHCIYGVDRNPLAVELCRTALWIETLEPGKPLTFLDRHIRCGDSLLGVHDLGVLREGLPDAAYKALTGDDKDVAKYFEKENKKGRKAHEDQLTLDFGADLDAISREAARLDALPQEDIEQVSRIARGSTTLETRPDLWRLKVACDLYTAAFFIPKTEDLADWQDTGKPANHHVVRIPTTDHIRRRLEGHQTYGPLEGTAVAIAGDVFAFHWPLAFPEVLLDRGGFDCVLGNPPWERVKLQEQEFFASRSQTISGASNKAERGRLIAALAHDDASPADRALHTEFERAKRMAEASSIFVRVGRFPLTGVGDVNTYALFAELFLSLCNSSGLAGACLPTGIATDDTTKKYFGTLIEESRLASLHGFSEVRQWFPSTDDRKPFCLLTLAPGSKHSVFVYSIDQLDELRDERRHVILGCNDIRLINPNTRTCPIFRTNRDAELVKKIYCRVPVLIDEGRGLEGNPWRIGFSAMFHMANDSGLFRTAAQFHEHGARFSDSRWIDPAGDEWLPLYEAKMIHHYDHRWATYEPDGETIRDTTPLEKTDPSFELSPRYWVPEREVRLRAARVPPALKRWLRARDEEKILKTLAEWVVGWMSIEGQPMCANDLASIFKRFTAWPACLGRSLEELLRDANVLARARATQWEIPLSDEDVTALVNGLDDPLELAGEIIARKQPRWMLGWREICRSTDERTVIASTLPRIGTNNKLPLAFTPLSNLSLALTGMFTSLVLDFTARQKFGSTSLSYFYLKQFPILPPSAFDNDKLNFIKPRVLELTYISCALRPWAEDLGYTDPPFPWDPDHRAVLRAELDAFYAHLYGLTRDELRYILDPPEVYGADFPSETFRVLKQNEIGQHGEYRTARLVLEAWDRFEADGTFTDAAPAALQTTG